MTITKRAIRAISLLLATILMAPAICAMVMVSENPLSASDDTGLQAPSGIAVDTRGNIYVTDTRSDSIWKYSPTGAVITKWGSRGSGEGQFSDPLNIAIDSQDFIYVTDFFNNRIQKFSSSGTYISHWDFLKGAPGICPTAASPSECWETHSLGGLAAGTDGSLYIADRSNYSIYKTTPDGKFLARVGSEGAEKGQFNNPSDIAVDMDGNFFVADYGNSRVQKFSANGTFLISWGSRGTGDGQFLSPGGIGVDQNGFVYVTDTGLHRVQKFTNSGVFVTKWGMEGIKDGQFSYPHDVAVDGNDNVYVTDFNNHRIQKFTADGSFLLSWGESPHVPENPSSTSEYTGFQHPAGIAVDTMGNIYVTTYSSIWEFSSSGGVITKWGSGGYEEGRFDKLVNIAIDNQGFIYVTDLGNDRIQKFSSTGAYHSQWDYFEGAPGCPSTIFNDCSWQLRDLGGIAAGNDGNMFIVQPINGIFVKVSPEGKYLAEWNLKGTNKGYKGRIEPTDIAIDRQGDIFVADFANSRVQKFSANGTYLTSFGSNGTGDGQFSKPYGIGVDRKGFVYVTDTGLHRVQKFTNSGVFVTKWGTEGTKDGEFAEPRDVAVDGNDYVYVTDFDSNCIQKFTAEGLFLMKWCGSPEPSSRQTPILLKTIIPNPNLTPRERDDGININVSQFLAHMNEELHWGFSDNQIRQQSEKLQKTLEKKYVIENTWVHISNYSSFSEDLRDTIGITEEQRLALLYYEQKEMGYRMAYMEIPGFKSPETPHFVINGTVTDAEGRPVPDAVVKFESDLVVEKTLMNWIAEDTRLSSTTRTGTDGTYHINVAWGNKQNASVTEEGYLNYTRSGINLTNESNTIDFQLTPLARATPSTPGFLFFPVLTAIMLAWLIVERKR